MRPLLSILSVLAVVVVILLPRVAAADQGGGHTVPVAILSFDSEDAEDQADAFTGALRSRVRASQGWSLIETSQSLGMLTAALKCPARPTPDCQQRIGEQIKAERYIWGYVSRGPQSGQVTAEIHLYQRGKSDNVIRENYADNLKDQNDDTLRKIAQRVLDRLGGNAMGSVVVHGPADMNGEVIVDGDKRIPLTGGNARLELGPGSHSVEVVPSSGSPTKRTVLVAAGKESVVDVATPGGTGPTGPTEPTEPEKPFPTKKVIGGIALGGGIILGAIAVQQALFYSSLQDRGNEEAAREAKDAHPCDSKSTTAFCDDDGKARTASGLAIGLGAAGAVAIGVGVYFLFIASDSPEKAATKPRVLPLVGTSTGGLAITGGF